MLKALQLVNWLRVKNQYDINNKKNVHPLTQLRAMKLLYYMQAASLVTNDEPLFKEPIVAWKFGPAVVAIHQVYKGQKYIDGTISASDKNNYNKIQNIPKTVALLNKVLMMYCDLTDSQLVDKTHAEMPWKNSAQSNEISLSSMKISYKDSFNDADWQLIKRFNRADKDSLEYTVLKEKLADRGLLPSSIHDVNNEDDFWDQF